MKIWVTYILTLLSFSISAQQLPVHSGNNLNPYLYNPAVGGYKPYIDFRLQHKSQWLGIKGAPSTQLLSGHSSVDKKKYGLGGYVYNDRAGVLSNTGLSLSYSYHVNISEKTKLSFGLSGSIAQYRINRNNVILVHDEDPLVNVSNTANTIAPNAGAGLFLYKQDRFYVGISGLNLLPFNINYQHNSVTPQVTHLYFIASKNILVGESLSLRPTALLNYIGNNPLMADFRLKIDYNEIYQLELGYRLKDGIIAGFGIYPHPDFGINYNYNLSLTTLRTGNFGSHEIMLNYIFYYKPDYKKVRRRYKWIDTRQKKSDSDSQVPQID